ncbi:hypothetical protein D0T60_16835 [Bacteroides sp. 224]|nr:hypothetical protein [Bacteroides sp. 224]
MMLIMPGFATAAAKFCYGRDKFLLRPRQNLVAAVEKSCCGRGKNLIKAIRNMPQGTQRTQRKFLIKPLCPLRPLW